jgi:hypothetical protein
MAEAETEEKEIAGSGPSTPAQPLDKGGDPESTPKVEEKKDGTPAAPPVSKLYKVKIDGEEREVTDEELVRSYQLDRTSYKRFEEASQLKKDAQTFLDMIGKDARETMIRGLAAKHGGDKQKGMKELRDLAVSEVRAMMEEEGLSPEVRAARQKDSELSDREQELKAREEEIERGRLEAEAAIHESKIEAELPEAMKKAGIEVYADTPKEKEKREFVIKAAILQVWQWADQNGIQMSFEDCAREVKKQRTQSASEYAQTLSPDEFKRVFGKQYEALRKSEIEALRNGSTQLAPTPKKDGASTGRAGRPNPKGMSTSEYSRALAEYIESTGQ